MPFILDGLETEDYDRSYSDRELLRRIGAYFRPHRPQMLLAALALALNSAAGTAGPILIARGLDLVAASPSVRALALISLGVTLLAVFAWGLNYLRTLASTRIVGAVVLKIREDAYQAVLDNDQSFFDAHPSGAIVSRISSDTQDFSGVVTLVLDLASELLLVLLLLAWLATIDAGLTLIIVGLTPLAFAVALGFRRVARQVTRHAKRITATINSEIQESISGITVAKSFRQEGAIWKRFLRHSAQAYRVGLTRGLTVNTIFPVLSTVAGLGIALLVWSGGLKVRGGELSPGAWFLFMEAVSFLWWPMISIASFWSQFQDGLSAAERVFALLDTRPKVRQTAALPVSSLRGEIEFRSVSFSYTGRDKVLDGFDLHVPAGQSLALVGHTGAGKSSVARLIARFYEFQEGELAIDGRDARSLDLGELRRHLGVVSQDPVLFSGTVGDNIRYGLPDADPARVRQAALRIAGGSWLEALANGLDTEVGARGASLSMGQRQLVALARVLLKDPAILILDEATASVDPFTETQIQRGLEQVVRGRTSIVIAHRLSTVRHADRIIVLDRGRIAEEGTHEQLLARGGRYGQLYNTYFRHQSLEYVEGYASRSR